MRKRSRLRSGRRGRGWLWIVTGVAIAGAGLAGLYFFADHFGQGPLRFLVKKTPQQESLLGSRGTIFDRNYKELAVTLDRVSVYADVRDIDPGDVAVKLSPILDVQEEVIKGMLSGDQYRAWLAKDITQEEEEKISGLGLRGVFLHKERARFYPGKNSAAHVVGFVGKSMGLAGVEYRYNSLLSKYGTQLVDEGAELLESEQGEPRRDNYIVLTLDMKIQEIIEDLVTKQSDRIAGSKVGALLMDVSDGGIIGTAISPSFDPNRFEDYGFDTLENMLATPILVPESIQRILWDASLLQSRYEAGGSPLPWSIISTKRSLGSQLKLWDRLGMNDRLEVDFIKRETNPLLMDGVQMGLDEHSVYDSMIENTTPMHLVNVLSALVMGERRPVPHVVDRISGADKKVYKLNRQASEIGVPEAVAREIRNLLTAQLAKGPVSSGYLEVDTLSYHEDSKRRNYARNRLFMSLIPQEKPQLMLFVFANLPPFSPSPSKTKSSFLLASHANKMILPMLARQAVRANLTDMMTAEERKIVNYVIKRQVGRSRDGKNSADHDEAGIMPNLIGISMRKSFRLLEDLKVQVQVSGTGVVIEQHPEPGAVVKPGELCQIVLRPD